MLLYVSVKIKIKFPMQMYKSTKNTLKKVRLFLKEWQKYSWFCDIMLILTTEKESSQFLLIFHTISFFCLLFKLLHPILIFTAQSLYILISLACSHHAITPKHLQNLLVNIRSPFPLRHFARGHSWAVIIFINKPLLSLSFL